MSEARHTDRPPITLEQLLRLKRSERPDPAFWEDFDRELRRRQLASVVARPAWHVRLGRSLIVGVRRAVPIGAAAAAAVGGFWVLQRPADDAATPTQSVAAADVSIPVEPVLIEPALSAELPELAAREPRPAPAPAAALPPPSSTSEPRFVVHEFAASTAAPRTFVSVTSPHTFSSPTYDASLQTVNTLSSNSHRRASARAEAASF